MAHSHMHKQLAFVFLLFGFSLGFITSEAAEGSAPDWRSKYGRDSISNDQLTVRYYVPDKEDGYYRGTRFDWSGLIYEVEYRGHVFFCEFQRNHDPLNHDDICGTAEEFGMTVPPPGFEEAPPNGTFMKIGVGVLRRGTEKEYGFYKRYEIADSGDWKISKSSDRVEFTHRLSGPGGYSYIYSKVLSLDAARPVLRVRRELKNTGQRSFITDHYGHNFLQIDGRPADDQYRLEFHFTPQLANDGKPEGCVDVDGLALRFLGPVPEGKSVWVPIKGFDESTANWTKVLNANSGASIVIDTDLPLARLVLYSSNGVVCPEPFVKFTLAPGETKIWTTTYALSVPSSSKGKQ